MMEYTRQIYTVVRHGLGEKIAELTREAGARGGTIIVGRGKGNSGILRMLVLSDFEKDILLTLATEMEFEKVFLAIQNAQFYKKRNEGISYIIRTGGSNMKADVNAETKHELITIIVNRGYADDVMEAARKEGARGGTIIHARGTGKPHDEKFFGITIVPEKEQVQILAEKENSQAIKAAISNLKCLTTPGIGIMFTSPVEQFVTLGKK